MRDDRENPKKPDDPWEQLRGAAPDATGELSAEEFVRELRDAWPDADKRDAAT